MRRHDTRDRKAGWPWSQRHAGAQQKEKEVTQMQMHMQMLLWTIRDRVRMVRDNEDGQGMVEYALILSLVSIAAIAVLGLVGGQISTVLNTVWSALGGVAS
jgi:pilus assembly protein Flp/PilA